MDPLPLIGGIVLFSVSTLVAVIMSRRFRDVVASGEALTRAVVLMLVHILQLVGLAFILGALFN